MDSQTAESLIWIITLACLALWFFFWKPPEDDES